MTGRFTFLLPWLALLFMGAAWGLSFSFAVIATGAGGTPFGITFWQWIVCGGFRLGYTLLRGRPMPLSGRHLRIYLYVALLGASIPNSLYYFSAPHVDAGVLSITVTLIPMVTYAVALALGSEVRSLVRVSGVICGAIAILMLVLPENSLPSRDAIPWLLLACVSAVCYALENIYLSRPGQQDIGPVRTACGMNLMAAALVLPVGLATGQAFLPTIPFGTLEWTIIGLGIINALAYTTFIAVIGMAGPVFASQTGYVVTLAGVFWGMALFGEQHSPWVWASLVTMLVGMSLVSPRQAKSNKSAPLSDASNAP